MPLDDICGGRRVGALGVIGGVGKRGLTVRTGPTGFYVERSGQSRRCSATPSIRTAISARPLSCPLSRRDGPDETYDSSKNEPAQGGDGGYVQPKKDASYCVVAGDDHRESQRKDAEENRDGCKCRNSRRLLRPQIAECQDAEWDADGGVEAEPPKEGHGGNDAKSGGNQREDSCLSLVCAPDVAGVEIRHHFDVRLCQSDSLPRPTHMERCRRIERVLELSSEPSRSSHLQLVPHEAEDNTKMN